MKENPVEEIRQLLESDKVTEPTRAVLLERLHADANLYSPQFFTAEEFSILEVICEALAPSQVVPCCFVASEIDKRLHRGGGNGWRYSEMPSDGEAYKLGLQILNEKAQQISQQDFIGLANEQRREIFQQFQQLEYDGKFSVPRFLEELFAEFAEIFYSHPLVQHEIGYIGFADAKGWDLENQIPNSKFQISNVQTSNSQFAIRNSQSSEVVDAVIIGTGAGGAPLLARLARAGLKVVALEAGKEFDYQKFPTDERAQVGLFWNDERLSAGKNPVAFGNNNSGCGVGGSTVHFTAYTPRSHPDDFRLFTDFGAGRDWCLSYEDLEPYFDEIEQFIGVSGASPYPWGKPRRQNYPLPPLPLNAPAKLMQRACAELNIKTAPAPNAALSAEYYQEGVGWRPRCTNRGFCQAGCSIGAKSSVDATFIPFAKFHGAEVRAECFVTGFEFDSSGKINSVVYTREGKIERQKCRNVFLCAGAIETPRLLLINGLANSSGQVGKNFMAHPGVQVWGVFDEATYPHKGIPGGLISEDTHRPQKKFNADFVGGYLLQSIGVMPVTYSSQLARGEKIFGAEIAEWMRDYNHTAGINILGECLPYAENFVELSEEKDGRGLPKPQIHFTAGENERRMAAHAEKLMREIWQTAGARKMWSFNRHAHVIGTCRMGADADDSVVNENGQSFDVPNLYICDNSIFPSALAVNPSLTIMALGLRTADKFLEKQK